MAEGTAAGGAPLPTGPLRVASGSAGLDAISGGGLPAGEVVLVTGTTGTGKTVLAAQFLAAGAALDEPGVFVTLEESPAKVRRFMSGFGWDIAGWEAAGVWAFLDASVGDEREVVVGEEVDLSALISRVTATIRRIGARRVVVDSITGVLSRLGDSRRVRAELQRLVRCLEGLDVTTVVTSESDCDHDAAPRYGVEQFVADNVVILRNTLDQDHRRRTIEALKLRGVAHLTGEYPFDILPGEGLAVASLTDLTLTHPSSTERATFGNSGVDELCDGGALKGSAILVSGPTGIGKSLLALEFAASVAGTEGRSLYLAFEESHEQVAGNGRAWGHDITALEAADRLRLQCQYPESAPLPAHLIRIQKAVTEFAPARVVVDSMSAIERSASRRVFQEFMLGLSAFLKERAITTLSRRRRPGCWEAPPPAATRRRRRCWTPSS
ncbi:MAG: circadian clock protein KaiC [Frankiales bacterium]|nr:MAG: circadian clock protein KaiC [Frankiales bacterium]